MPKKINPIDSEFGQFDARFEEMKALNLKTRLMIEQQNAFSRYCIEMIKLLSDRADRIEQKIISTQSQSEILGGVISVTTYKT